jgi:hypothetical protein
MNSVEEIEHAIEQLPPKELARLTAWLVQRENDSWDRQMDSDSAEGRLDFLFEEADREREKGKLRDWPPPA